MKLRNMLKVKTLSIIFLLTAMSVSAQTWQIGSPNAADVTATLDGATLTISGTGAMQDWNGIASPPWSSSYYYSSVIIENGVTNIGNFAFAGCGELTYLQISNSVTSIGDYAFFNCTGLTIMFMSGSLTSIGNYAFSGCSGLTDNLNISNSVTSIGDYAFSECTGLTVVASFSSALIGTGAFSGCSGITYAYMAATSIGSGAFSDCTSLTFADIHFAESIGGGAFSGCTSLVSLNATNEVYIMPDIIKSIEGSTFSGCTALTAVSIPNSVTAIGGYAFHNCSALKDVAVYWLTPLYVADYVFGYTNTSSITLHVPEGTESLYAAAPVWKNFKIIGDVYSITASAGSNGSISPSGVVYIDPLFNIRSFYFTPNTGYDINQVLVDGVNNTLVVSDGSYTFKDITANHTISVSFKRKPSTITASAGSGGSISPNGNVTVNYGNDQVFTFTPNTGYVIDRVLVNEINNATAVSTGSYTFTNVTANQTISVSFKPIQYTITASAESGGSISPNGIVTVNFGNNQAFTFTPNIGYNIDQVLVDGTNNTTAVSTGSYTFTNVTANHTISVSFKQKPQYTITASAGSGGSISPNGIVTVNYGNNQAFTFMPNIGYNIDQVLVDGTNNTTAVSAGSYTFTNVIAPHTISVSFKPIQYTITASAESGGSISPNGNVTVNYGNNQAFTFTPNIGYNIDQVLVDGTNNTTAVSAGSYTFTNVTAPHTISVSFKQKPQYTITASAGSGGYISQSGVITVNQGDSQTFTFTPNTNYNIDQVLVDGTNNTTAVSTGSYTFANVMANHTISVSFKPDCLSNIIVQVWDDVLSVVNNPANNGGYTFVSYQWLKNGVEIAGETSGNLYLENHADKTMSDYTCRVRTSNGQTLESCPFQSSTQSSISAYPNPTNGTVIIENSTIKEGDKIGVYSSTGTLVKQYSATPCQTKIDIGNQPKGIYIIKVNGEQVKVILL